MTPKLLVSLPVLLLANAACGQALYLTCTTTSRPALDFKRIYKTPPAQGREQFIGDMASAGLLGVLVDKAESWEIKVAEATVESPEANSGPKFSGAAVTESKVSASHISPVAGVSYELNRITGKLTYSIQLSVETREAWTAKHGGQLPLLWKWEQACTGQGRPKI